MGKIASQFANKIILTTEDPRSEEAEDICREIAKGLVERKKVLGKDFFIILDRAKAIEYALSLAKKTDIVALFGKGHEKTMVYGKREIPYSERETVIKALKKLNGK